MRDSLHPHPRVTPAHQRRAPGTWVVALVGSLTLILLCHLLMRSGERSITAVPAPGQGAAVLRAGDGEDTPISNRSSPALPGVSSRPTSSMYGVSQRECTRAFLDAFPAALPELRTLWDGEDFCAWPGVLCTLQGVHVDVSACHLSGQLPELSDLVDGSMVVLLSINLSANRDLRGTLPVSWAGLDTVAYINVASTGLSGTIPRAWYGMDALKTVDITDTCVALRVAISTA